MRVLFLVTDLFSSSSGIARMARLVCKSLNDCSEVERLDVISLVDSEGTKLDSRYLAGQKASYRAASGLKVRFVAQALARLEERYDICLASHVGLAPVLVAYHVLSPRTKLASFVHGIEIWQRLKRLKQAAVERLDAIYSVSDFTRRQMIAANNLRGDKVHVIHNCLDPYLMCGNGEVAPTAGPVLRHPNLLTVSRLSRHDRYKGHAKVIEALAKVRQRMPDVDYYIVGTGELIPELQELVAELGLLDRVHFLGSVSDAELREIYRQCDIFAMPSRLEGFGLVFAEAMAYGKPVIAGNRDASGEVVQDGKTGLLVNPDNVDEIAAAVEQLLSDRVLRERLGAQGARVVSEKFCFARFERELVLNLRELAR